MIKTQITNILEDLKTTSFSKIYKRKNYEKGDDKTFSKVSIEYYQNEIFFCYSNWNEGKEIESFSKHFSLVEYPQAVILFNKVKKLIKLS